MDTNRKNGKPASCEPCRRSKVRCDHSRPTCSRCRKRDVQCWWHPAPLTKERILVDSLLSPVHKSPPSSAHTHSTLLGSSEPAPHGLNDHQKAIDKLVAHVSDIAAIQDAISNYYTSSAPFVGIPTTFLLPTVADLHARWQDSHDQQALLREISRDILTTAKVQIVFDQNTTPSDFIRQHRGKSLRIEMLGIIYTIAARSSLFDCVHLQTNGSDFAHKMWQASNKALSWARKHLPRITDALTWLAYENLLLTTQITGDTSMASWRCLGDFVSDILAVGMHRESSYGSLPFFLAQIRRRALMSSYNLDKFMSLLLGRPPRLSKRYIDCQMPLDLPEADLVAEVPPSSRQLESMLTSDGWSREARYSGSTHARVRYMQATIREEVADFDYSNCQGQPQNNVQQLLNLLQRSHDTWRALPSHLHYTADCWSSDVSTTTCLMLVTVYLSYKDLDLNIYQLLQSRDAFYSAKSLELSYDVVTALLQLGAVRTRASFLSYDFAYLIIAHGIPSARQLAECLAGTKSLPSTLSLSALIRTLSVFVASLESLHYLSDSDRSIVSEAIGHISHQLDDVLSTPGSLMHARTAGDHHGRGGEATSARTLNLFGDDGNNNFMNDNSAWLNDFDWTNFGSDWIKF